MKPEAQRIAIAEAVEKKRYVLQDGCFYQLFTEHCPQPFSCLWKDGRGYLVQATLHDYLNDLNAMHEAEKELREPQVMAYILKLRDIVERIDDTGENGIEMTLIHLTAAQRAEAFLRTLGKWVEE